MQLLHYISKCYHLGMTLVISSFKIYFRFLSKLEWGCPNGTKYPPRQPIQTPQVMRLKSFYLTARLNLTARASTDGRTDRVIPVYPPNFFAGGIIISIPNEELFSKTAVGALLHTLSKLYDVPVGLVTPTPPPLRLCISLFAIAEGWLLLNIGWFVLFMNSRFFLS